MNEHVTDLNFSRRDLLKGGGALIVGFSMAGLPADVARAARGDVPGPFDMNAIDTWIAIHADNTATVYIGKGELGQGATTGLLQIAAEELDLDMSQVRSVQLDTNVVPNQGATVSSASIERGGPQIRAAAAEARRALLNRASARLGMQIGSLVVNKGIVSIDGHPTQSVSYGALLGDKPFNVKFTGTAPQKAITRYTVVGTNVPRVDIPEKAAGTYTHIQHVRLPGMLHGRVVRPRGQRAYGVGAKPLAIDEFLDQGHSRAHRAQGRLRRRGGGERVGRDPGGARAQGDLAGDERAAGQRRPVHPDAGGEDVGRHHCELGRCGKGVRQGRARLDRDLLLSIPVARAVRSELRHRRCRRERRARNLLDPGHLRFARHAGGSLRRCRSIRCACNTSKARAPSAEAATRIARRPRR